VTNGHDQATNGHDQTWTPTEGDHAPDSEALADDIEATRGAMTETVQAIGDRLSPSNIVADAKATVREATVGKVEEMADTAGRMLDDAGYTAQNAGGSIVETIRRNPVPAAMAAVGIGWLMTHRSNPNRYDRRAGYGSWATDQAYGGQRDGGPRQALAEIGDTVGERAGEVGETLRQVPQDVRYRADSVGQQAGRLMEESPLVAGAVAVAVGAVIGSLIPSTEVEQRVLGPATERAIDTAEQVASEKLAEIDTTSTRSTGGTMS
jgi:hypothetical protein